MWAWWGVAWAAEPLVHQGDPGEAVERASLAARIPEADLAPTSVDSLRERPPSLVGSGAFLACGGDRITPEQLLLAVSGAESALTYGEVDRARAELARVEGVFDCPPAFDRELLVRLWTARALAGEEPGRAFGFARALAPSLAAGEGWSEASRSAFEAAAPLPPVRIRVPHAGVTIDGQPASGDVSVIPGWHTVTAGPVSGALEVDADATLLVPAATGPDAFDAVASTEGRALPTALLADAFGEGTRVFVATDQGVWAATAGRTDWLALQRRKAHPLLPVGLGTAAAGAVGTAVASLLAASAWSAVGQAGDQVRSASSVESLLAAEAEFQERADRYSALRLLPVPFAVVTALGAGLAGTGLALGPVEIGGGS